MSSAGVASRFKKYRGWYDVQDRDGVWRLAKCIEQMDNGLMVMHLDGWSHKYDALYCAHSDRIAEPRTYTRGLTCQEPYPLREPFQDIQPLTNAETKLRLILNSGFDVIEYQDIVDKLNNTPNCIVFFSVELLIYVDSILTLPFFLQDVKQGVEINKLFIGIVNLAIKVLETSHSFLPTRDANPRHKSLHASSFQIFRMVKSIFGLDSRHSKFFQHPENMFIKSEGYVESFLKSTEGGLLLINSYLKNAVSHCLNSELDFSICIQLITLLFQLYDKKAISEEFNNKIILLLDTISNYLRYATRNPVIHRLFQESPRCKYITNVYENIHMKLKPSKRFTPEILMAPLHENNVKKKRKDSEEVLLPSIVASVIGGDIQSQMASKNKPGGFIPRLPLSRLDAPAPSFQKKKLAPSATQAEDALTLSKMNSTPSNNNNSNNNNAAFTALQARLEKLEAKLEANQKKQKDLLEGFLKQNQQQNTVSIQKEGIGEKKVVAGKIEGQYDFNQMSFLNSLQFELMNGNVQKAQKMVAWRKKIVQLSTIVGWKVATQVARNTIDKLEVETKDILSTNLNYLKQAYSL